MTSGKGVPFIDCLGEHFQGLIHEALDFSIGLCLFDQIGGNGSQPFHPVLVLSRKAAIDFIESLKDANHLTVTVAHWDAQHTLGAVTSLAVHFGIKALISIGVFYIDDFTASGA